MTDEVNEVETDEEFEAAFKEAAEARESDADANTDDDEGAGNGEASADTTAAKDADSNLNTADQDADNDEADTAKDDAVSDEFEGMTDAQITAFNDLKAQNADLDHRIKSDAGRVSAFQRQINSLKHEITNIQKAPNQPSTEDIADAMATDEGWKEFSEEYPEVAGAIDKRLNAQQEQIDSTLAPVLEKQSTDAAKAAESEQQEHYDTVAKDFPTWQTAVNTQEFNDWMADQSPGVQALANSDDTRDASLLIGKYDDFRVDEGYATLRADPESSDVKDDSSVDEVAERRAQQLEDGTTLPSKRAQISTDSETGSEFENAFNAFAKRKEAANNRA